MSGSRPIAVHITDTAGGTQLNGGQAFFRVEGEEVILLGDPVQGHGPGVHAGPVMAQGTGWFRLNGTPACREGHVASCGHPSTGRAWFRIDGST